MLDRHQRHTPAPPPAESERITGMGERIRNGRTQIDKAGVRAYVGAGASTVNLWHRACGTSGFPKPAETDDDGRAWWWLDDIKTFWTAHLTARAALFTRADHRGEPDDLLSAPQAAKILGYKDHRSLPDALIDNPDQTEELPSGRLRRWWYRRTVWAYADSRPLRRSTGRPLGATSSPRKTHPYADDPRLDIARQLLTDAHENGTGTSGLGVQLARRLGIHERAAQRLIQAALHASPEDQSH